MRGRFNLRLLEHKKARSSFVLKRSFGCDTSVTCCAGKIAVQRSNWRAGLNRRSHARVRLSHTDSPFASPHGVRSVAHTADLFNHQGQFLSTVIQRIFGALIFKKIASQKTAKARTLDPIRERFYSAMRDCSDWRAERMLYKIKLASTAADLWLLRSDLHLCISQLHSQQVAAERINALIPAFEGLLPARQLSRI